MSEEAESVGGAEECCRPNHCGNWVEAGDIEELLGWVADGGAADTFCFRSQIPVGCTRTTEVHWGHAHEEFKLRFVRDLGRGDKEAHIQRPRRFRVS